MVSNILEFIQSYSSEQYSKIKFAWDRSENFFDPNLHFRRQVIEFALSNSEDTSVELFRDLFVAEIELAKQAWCVHCSVHPLAELMLISGGSKYLKCFLQGKRQSFDTYCECGRVRLPKEMILQFLSECKQQLNSKLSEKEILLWEHGVEFFGNMATLNN